MRYLLLSALPCLFILHNVPLPPCEHDDFHVSFRFNDSCATQTYIRFEKLGSDFHISSGRTHTEEIGQFLHVFFLKESNLNDTLWIDSINSNSSANDKVSVRYSYVESSGISGGYNIIPGQGTRNDYMIIDYYNADTTIIEGRFQCKFTEGSAASWVGAPDTIVITDGSFKVMME